MPIANGTRSPRVRALGAALRQAREQCGISNRALAARLSVDQSHLSRIETGKKTPSVEITAMILAALRTPPAERERILQLARGAEEPNWLTVGIPSTPEQIAGVIECERAASRVTEWHQNLIPGLLQTTEYARVVITGTLQVDGIPSDDPEIEYRVSVRNSRRQILTGRDPVEFIAFLSESALLDPLASSRVMAEQLRHLVKMGQEPNVTIRVVPRDIGYHPGLAGAFVLYEFDDAKPVVHFEHHISAAFDQDEDDARAYRRVIQALDRIALDEVESVDMIARTIVDRWSDHDCAADQVQLIER